MNAGASKETDEMAKERHIYEAAAGFERGESDALDEETTEQLMQQLQSPFQLLHHNYTIYVKHTEECMMQWVLTM